MADEKVTAGALVDNLGDSSASGCIAAESGETSTVPTVYSSDEKPALAAKCATISPSVRNREGLKLDCLLCMSEEERLDELKHFNLPDNQFLSLTSLLELHEWLIFHDVSNYVFPRAYLWHLLTLSNENRNKCLEVQDLGKLGDKEARTVGDLIRWIATQDSAMMKAEIERKPVYRKWSFLDRIPNSSERLPLRNLDPERDICRRLSENYGKCSRSTNTGDQ